MKTPKLDNGQDSLTFLHSELFQKVQIQSLFRDGKTFADARPKFPIEQILQNFEQLGAGDLAEFVDQHFSFDTPADVITEQPGLTVAQHIEQLWPLLRRPADPILPGSLLPLKHPYIVPGGRFCEIYYWDCYFTALGLIEAGDVALVTAMFDNLVDLQTRFGHIPNGNRSYYLTRSQPPILALLLDLLLPLHTDKQALLQRGMSALEAEYKFWMQGELLLDQQNTEHRRVVRMPDGSVLNRYWDDACEPRSESYREDTVLAAALPEAAKADFYRNVRAACESGWDFSTRWLGQAATMTSIRTTRIVPIDLNSLLYNLENSLANGFSQLNCAEKALHYRDLANRRKAAINRYLWSSQHGWFCDYDLDLQQVTATLSLAAVVPLFVGQASRQQAQLVANTLSAKFLHRGGLTTSLIASQQQWDAPNGWAPLHWFAVKGLAGYGNNALARIIATRWIDTVELYFERHGKLMEKYDVGNLFVAATGGEYDVQEGFGWTNGVTMALYRYLAHDELL